MRLVIEAEPGELAARAGELLKALAQDLAAASPEAAATLAVLEDRAEAAKLGKPMRDGDLEALRQQLSRVVQEELGALEHELAALVAEDMAERAWGLSYADVDIRKAYDGMDVLSGVALDGTVWVEPLGDELEKALSHKYLARVATGNPKRPWRYIYSYTGERWMHEHDLRYEHKDAVTVGTKIRDKGTDHRGHWEVTSVAGDGSITLKHDETGETMSFKGRSGLRAYIKDHHRAEISASNTARLARRHAEATASHKTAVAARAQFEAEPSMANLRRAASAWERFAAAAIEARWDHADYAKAYDFGAVKAPKTFKAYRQLVHNARELLERSGRKPHQQIASPREDVRRAHLALRYLVREAAPPSSMTVDLSTVLQYAGPNPSKEDAIKAIAKAASTTKSRLNNVRLRLDYPGLSDALSYADTDADKAKKKAAHERIQTVLQAAYALPGVVVHSEEMLDPDTNIDANRRHEGESRVTSALRVMSGEAPRPIMYRAGYLQKLNAADPAEFLEELTRTQHNNFEPPKGEGFDIATALLRAPADTVTVSISAPSRKKTWRSVPVLLSDAIRAAKHDAMTNVPAAIAEHQAVMSKIETAREDLAAKIGDMTKIHEEAVQEVLDGAGVQLKQALDMIPAWHLPYAIVEAIDPTLGKLHEFAKRDPYAASQREKKRWQLRDEVDAAITEAVLRRIEEKVAPKTDVDKARTHAMMPAPKAPTVPNSAELGAPVDVSENPGLQRVWRFLHPDNVPKTAVYRIDKPGRAYAGRRAIVLFKGESPSVLAHEYGHEIEHVSSGVTRAMNALRDHRGRNSNMQSFGEGYDTHEHYYPGEGWTDNYNAKWYGHNESTEVLSMGVQNLMFSPVDFYQRDPQHFLLTLAALTGRLGKADKNT